MPKGVYQRNTPIFSSIEEKKKYKAKKSREWLKNNPRKAWDTKLWINYKITADQYDSFSKNMNHRCAICRQPESIIDSRTNKPRRLAVDHDSSHPIGLIRGLLCSKCNRGIGMFNHDPRILREAIRYLNYFTKITVPGVANAFKSGAQQKNY